MARYSLQAIAKSPDRQPRWKTRLIRASLLLSLALSFLLAGLGAAPHFSQAAAPPRPLAVDPTVQAIINQVQSDSLYNYVAGLSGVQPLTIGGSPVTLATRSTTASSSINKATQYAYEHFQALGLAASYHTWTYSGGTRRNVVADQPGANTGCLYLLTAHLDDTSNSPNTLAPGADDNASGASAVLLGADILSQYNFTCSLRYILFTGEEQGLLGSDAYAHAAADRGDPILGVLNLDMLAYNSPGSAATIEMDIRTGSAGNPDRVLTNMVTGVIQTYQLGLTPLVYASGDSGSDQYSFWTYGYPGVEVIEDWDDHTPYYHTTDDRLSSLDMAYYTSYTKAILGALAQLAGPIVTSPPPGSQPNHVYLAIIER